MKHDLDPKGYTVQCPDQRGAKKHPPLRVWRADDGQLMGTLGKHRNHGKTGDCPWSGLPVEAISSSSP